MKAENYDISFRGLKEGVHNFDYKINKRFFEVYPDEEIQNAELSVNLQLDKKPTLLDFHFEVSGNVMLQCDISNELFWQPISGNLDLVVKFGPEYNDDFLDILVVPHETVKISIAQYIYEMAILAVPLKRVHPGVEDGTLKSPVLDKLREIQIKESKNSSSTDPRWDKLKELT